MIEIIVSYNIKANEKSCGKCNFCYTYRGMICGLFSNKQLKPLGKGYARLEECKQAELNATKIKNAPKDKI